MSETIGIRFQQEVLEALERYVTKNDVSRSEAVNALLKSALRIAPNRKESQMYQDRESGAQAVKFGYETARRLAAKMGAKKTSRPGNEYEWEGRKICIKCARAKTTSVGVTYKMLERLDDVVAAFEAEDGIFDLYSLSPRVFEKEMRATRSTGPSAGRVGLVSKRVFENQGRHLKKVKLS